MNRFIIVTIFSCLTLLSGCSAPNKDFKKAEILQAERYVKEKNLIVAVDTKMFAYIDGELVLVNLQVGSTVKILVSEIEKKSNSDEIKKHKPKKKQILL